MRPKQLVWTLRATLVPRGTHRKRLMTNWSVAVAVGIDSLTIAADGKVFIISRNGFVIVLDGGGSELKILAKNDMDEEILATPSIADSRLALHHKQRQQRGIKWACVRGPVECRDLNACLHESTEQCLVILLAVVGGRHLGLVGQQHEHERGKGHHGRHFTVETARL